MKLTTREKLIRTILSSILSSDLSNKEIHSISDYLTRNEDIVLDLREILRDIANKLDIYSCISSKSDNPYSTVSKRIGDIFNIIKRKRISKNKIIDYMNILSPNITISNRYSLQEIIEEYINNTSEDTNMKFINLLETGGKGGDEYLQGIMNRR